MTDSDHKAKLAEPSETLETRMVDTREWYLEVLHEFALSQIGLNSLEEILWNVAKTAIARLGFVDCVIYLVDDSGQTLVQRAAHGPKNPIAHDIYNPITIPVGQGIVGAVAATGKAERVDDTRQDPRYIEDDEFRLSELAVPIIHDGRVIGVLDSEHPEPHFFTDVHLNLFSTIASLASTRIDTAMALDDLRETVDQLRVARDNLAVQANKLDTARDKAERASQEKSLFLANMSHEIRTPMTSIIGYSELLSRGDQSREKRQQWVGQVQRNADYLLQLLNELLDLSKIEAGAFKPNMQACNPARLIQDAYELIKPIAENKGLEMAPPKVDHLPRRIMLDVKRVTQICVNILSNATKYTHEGQIILEAAMVDPAATQPRLEITVHDTGTGIGADALDRIFEPFTRQNQTRDVADGSGLGLAISRGLALGLGGDLTVRSELDVGSRFTLTLPLVIADENQPCVIDQARHSSNAADGPALEGLVILVVEDTSSIALLLEHLLTTAGAEAHLAENGEQGAQMVLEARARGSEYDLVLMDMMMPVLDGYTATKRLREAGVQTPIVALTAMALNHRCERCIEAGCDYFLTKPINTSKFISQLCAILDAIRLADELPD